MEMWRWRKEMAKLNEVEKSLYNTMCRHPKHIDCPDIVLKRAKPKSRLTFGYIPYYGLYCKNHNTFLEWIRYDLLDDDSISKWRDLGIKTID